MEKIKVRSVSNLKKVIFITSLAVFLPMTESIARIKEKQNKPPVVIVQDKQEGSVKKDSPSIHKVCDSNLFSGTSTTPPGTVTSTYQKGTTTFKKIWDDLDKVMLSLNISREKLTQKDIKKIDKKMKQMGYTDEDRKLITEYLQAVFKINVEFAELDKKMALE